MCDSQDAVFARLTATFGRGFESRVAHHLECLRYFVPMVLDSYRKRFREKLWLCLYGCSHSFILAVVIIFDLIRGQIAKSLMWTIIIIKFHIFINGLYYSLLGEKE